MLLNSRLYNYEQLLFPVPTGAKDRDVHKEVLDGMKGWTSWVVSWRGLISRSLPYIKFSPLVVTGV